MSNVSNSNAWLEIGNQNKNAAGGIRNLKITSGPGGKEQTYRVRFVGTPITFYKFFVNNRSAITDNPTECIITKKYGTNPSLRHAVNLINRDDGQIYVAEVPPSVLAPVKEWAKITKKNPGGEVAVDFAITVKGQKKNTRYSITTLDSSTLTDEEKEMPLYDLNKLFKVTPESEIEAKLYPAVASPNQAQASNAPQSASKGVEMPF